MALREPREDSYLVAPARTAHLDEIARIEQESFLVPWKREFFESELSEPYRYSRVLLSLDGSAPVVGGYLFAVSLYEEFHINTKLFRAWPRLPPARASSKYRSFLSGTPAMRRAQA